MVLRSFDRLRFALVVSRLQVDIDRCRIGILGPHCCVGICGVIAQDVYTYIDRSPANRRNLPTTALRCWRRRRLRESQSGDTGQRRTERKYHQPGPLNQKALLAYFSNGSRHRQRRPLIRRVAVERSPWPGRITGRGREKRAATRGQAFLAASANAGKGNFSSPTPESKNQGRERPGSSIVDA